MRIWDFPVSRLCDRHLKAEHGELHCIWSVIVNEKRGYARHPETMRWRGKLRALYIRHANQVIEMVSRGITHSSDLEESLAVGEDAQTDFIDSIRTQIDRLKEKAAEGRCAAPSCLDRMKGWAY